MYWVGSWVAAVLRDQCQVQELMAVLDHHKQQLADAEEASARLQQELGEAGQAGEVGQARINELTETVAELERSKQQAADESNKKVADVKQKCTNLEATIREQDQATHTLQEEISTQKSTVAAVRQEKLEIDRQLASLRKSAKELQASNSELTSAKTSLEEEVKKANAMVAKLRLNQTQSEDQTKYLKKKSKELETAHSALLEEKKQIEAQLKDARNTKDTKEKDLYRQLKELEGAAVEKDKVVKALEAPLANNQ